MPLAENVRVRIVTIKIQFDSVLNALLHRIEAVEASHTPFPDAFSVRAGEPILSDGEQNER